MAEVSTGPRLAVALGPLQLKNPVVLASGTCGFGVELAPFCDPAAFGAVTLKGLTLEPRAGNPPPRLAESEGGMLNAIGLENPGYEGFVREKLPAIEASGLIAIANVSGNSEEEYVELCRRLDSLAAIRALELNVSCPNVRAGGIHFGQEAAGLAYLVAACRKVSTKPLLVKLSPNVTDVVALARACHDSGADALTLINTLVGMRIDIRTRRPLLANLTGGLSGPAIKPVALRIVHQVHKAVPLPILGMGGVTCWEDAVEFLLAGASAVGVGTATLVRPGAGLEILEGLAAYLEREGLDSPARLTGALVAHPGPPACG